jgi:cytidylate kinase
MTTASFRKTDFLSGANPRAAAKGKIVISVDGPAASGKGTLAKKLAERLGYAWLDTGALYRAVGFAVLEAGGDPSNERDAVAAVGIVKRNLTPELLASPALRAPAVSDAASKVAAVPAVRAELLDVQRRFAANPPDGLGGSVLDGRDIGTVVCPEADIKFFVTASAEERARRRAAETAGADYAVILADIKVRDERDSTRATAPTRPAEDAYIIDTTKLGIGETLEEAIAVIRSKFLEESATAG